MTFSVYTGAGRGSCFFLVVNENWYNNLVAASVGGLFHFIAVTSRICAKAFL